MSAKLKVLWASCVALIVGVVIGASLFERAVSSSRGVTRSSGGERIVMISHGQAADPYWNIVRNGALEAARQLGVRLEYRAPETFDMIRMAELIASATNQRPAGMIVTIPDAEALGPSIQAAVRAGIPVVSINSGSDVASGLGSMIHVGQDEYQTGKRVGERLRQSGAKKVACVNHEVGNTALDARCKGLDDGFEGPSVVLPTSNDYQEIKSKIAAALAGDRAIDALVTLSAPLAGDPAVEAAREAGRPMMVASFDLSPGFLEALSRGEASFAVDPQAFLQGYLGTVFVTNQIRYGLIPANALIESGPRFVTRAEAAKVLELSKKAIR
ncbi:sugar ABC transporter substrate-binding protein [Sphingomonas sp. RB56-2]|uniref:Sugar ABC transporter substrate-binding protein n=1 Tax=Sphingomonas brevis TaxID=2908206 RepID=A0ABT0S907_9SPHN|nr:sugar ABC transporter substrate-binding protein [Sphingomonas brevis]MCL6740803.1 sugar ABC transporter substrate-binding protein [Sphingomonas brevis]